MMNVVVKVAVFIAEFVVLFAAAIAVALVLAAWAGTKWERWRIARGHLPPDDGMELATFRGRLRWEWQGLVEASRDAVGIIRTPMRGRKPFGVKE